MRNRIARGIDVSYHQGVVDWPTVKQSGLADFAIIRTGFRGYGSGKIEEDKQFRNNIRGTNQTGIQTGAYFFSTALNEAEAVEEAKWTLNAIEGHEVAYPIVYDYEGYEKPSYRTYGTTKDQRTAACKAFLDTIREAGYVGLVYGSKGVIRSKFDLTALSDYGIWCARYAGGYDKIVDDEKYYPEIGEFTDRIVMWQYSSIGQVPGIKGNVDLNYQYKPFSSSPPEPGMADNYVPIGTYQNGSTPEPVYADTACQVKIGSLNARESCPCLGIKDNRAIVLYPVDGKGQYKVGFAAWLGGIR